MNVSKEEVLDIIKTFPIEPMFNKVVITLNKEEDIELSLKADTSLDEVQYVIAGSIKYGNTEVNPGDKVILDLKSMQKPVRSEVGNAYEPVYQIEVDPLFIDGKLFGIINDRNIKAKDNR